MTGGRGRGLEGGFLLRIWGRNWGISRTFWKEMGEKGAGVGGFWAAIAGMTLVPAVVKSVDVNAGPSNAGRGPAREAPIARLGRPAAAVSRRAAGHESRVSGRARDHGADPVELVPALRAQAADPRREYLLRQAGGLCEGNPDRLPLGRATRRPSVASRKDWQRAIRTPRWPT